VRRERWPEVEHLFKYNLGYAVHYAKYVMQNRWKEMESLFSEARTPTKEIPLMLGNYVLVDVPNTITDDQTLELLRLVGGKVHTARLYLVTGRRVYDERVITRRLKNEEIKRVEIRKLQDTQLDQFLRHMGINDSDSDFT
jgi:hypothetical protein